MSNDVQQIMDIMPFVNFVWSSPLQIALAVYFLWKELGPAVLSGLALMILLIPLNTWLAGIQKRMQVLQQEYVYVYLPNKFHIIYLSLIG